MHKKNRAQSLSEYAVVLGLVSVALVSMQVYIKRGMQGRLRDMANQISPVQYERANATANYTITRSSNITEDQEYGTFTRTINNDTTTRTGSEVTVGTD